MDAAFSAHTHAYERYRAGGTEYFVVGCGGAPFYALAEEKPEGYQAGRGQTLGYVRATISADAIDLEMVAVAEVPEGDGGVVTMYPAGTVIDALRLPADAAPESTGWWAVLAALSDGTALSRLQG